MVKSQKHAVTVMLTDDHLRKMVCERLLAEDEANDRAKITRVVHKLLEHALGLPEKPWHDWDDWVKGLE